MGSLGVVLGGLLFYWALRGVDPAEVKRILRNLNPGLVVAAWFSYLASLGVRIVRWQFLLRGIAPRATLSAIGETLVAGYAVNNVLPARLGEIFRADYARRRLGIGRSSALGSIVVERLLDGIVVVGLLWFGLAWRGFGAAPAVTGPQESTAASGAAASAGALRSIAITATVLIGIAALGLLLLFRGGRWHRRLPAAVSGRIERLIEGLASWREGPKTAIVGAALGVWLCESLALWLMFRALGVTLSLGELAMLMGAATLSTLVPTAPAYLGSYQFVFVTAMGIFGLPESGGIVAATSIQVVCYGTVTVVGLLILVVRASISVREVGRR